jgi:hypothetical protein
VTIVPRVVVIAAACTIVVRAQGVAPLTFENIARKAGVTFTLTSGTPEKLFLIESTGGGVAFTDLDNDGWPDLYFVNGSTLDDERRGRKRALSRLYRNNRDGTFTDVTEKAGVGGRNWGMGVCAGDVNGDGFEDIYVTNVGPNILYVNHGDGTFRDVAREAGVDDPAYGSSCAFADYDRDGDLDLYVSNYIAFNVHRPPERANDGTRCGYRGLVVACGPRGLTPAADRFYENRGGLRFVDVTAASGLGRVPPSYGMGVVWGDYDDDGDQDLYVANDEMPNFLFRNNGDRTFTEIGVAAGVALSPDGRAQGSMGVDFGDYDNDGDLDLIVTNFSDDYDTLYRNEGNGAFADGTAGSNIVAPTLTPVGWGVLFVDLDLDGWLDIPVANGHLYPQLATLTDLPVASGSGYRQRSLLFRNLANRRFAEVGERAGAGFRVRDAQSSRGLAAADMNNDGLMDLVMTGLDERAAVLLNRTRAANWLTVRLTGAAPNRSAIGARVTVRTGTRTQRRDVKSGGSYQSQSDLRAHFGLGDMKTVDELSVRWPRGRVDTLRNVAGNQVLVLEEKPE